jgi:spore coat polysaccharide biosynthesis protein SpsF (cytidylyltransferase family)
MDKRIIVGIQCRLASTRFPDKSIKALNSDGLNCINSLLDNVDRCNDHMSNKKGGFYHIIPRTAVLVPINEATFWYESLKKRSNPPTVMAGDPDDVLSRYTDLLNHEFDAVVRLTADCPNVPPLAINKAIFTLIHHRLDYISNVWEDCRTAIDGHDIEVLSKDALKWLSNNAKSKEEREHVTIAIRKQFPAQLRKAALIQKEDLSDIKLCVDTKDEFERASARFQDALNKKSIATRKGLGVYDY